MTPELGKLITTDEERDAVHIAIVPVVASELLPPGQHVGLIGPSRMTVGVSTNPIGIVDPFLRKDVRKGEKFWLFLYPNTITSLKHNWTHPAFTDVLKKEVFEKATDKEIAESKKWLEEFAEMGYRTYEDVIEMGNDYIKDGYSHIRFGSTTVQDVDRNEFWYHFQIVTGKIVRPEVIDNTYFSCSC